MCKLELAVGNHECEIAPDSILCFVNLSFNIMTGKL